eukprot:Sdes_comp18197_c0_seq1m7738
MKKISSRYLKAIINTDVYTQISFQDSSCFFHSFPFGCSFSAFSCCRLLPKSSDVHVDNTWTRVEGSKCHNFSETKASFQMRAPSESKTAQLWMNVDALLLSVWNRIEYILTASEASQPLWK